MRVDATEESPIVNSCFVIKNWNQNSKAILTINGESIPADIDTRQGIVRDIDGSWMLVAWFNMESVDAVEFEFRSN